jgi:hypothetical protein
MAAVFEGNFRLLGLDYSGKLFWFAAQVDEKGFLRYPTKQYAIKCEGLAANA